MWGLDFNKLNDDDVFSYQPELCCLYEPINSYYRDFVELDIDDMMDKLIVLYSNDIPEIKTIKKYMDLTELSFFDLRNSCRNSIHYTDTYTVGNRKIDRLYKITEHEYKQITETYHYLYDNASRQRTRIPRFNLLAFCVTACELGNIDYTDKTAVNYCYKNKKDFSRFIVKIYKSPITNALFNDLPEINIHNSWALITVENFIRTNYKILSKWQDNRTPIALCNVFRNQHLYEKEARK
jgi:hypothetical protein